MISHQKAEDENEETPNRRKLLLFWLVLPLESRFTYFLKFLKLSYAALSAPSSLLITFNSNCPNNKIEIIKRTHTKLIDSYYTYICSIFWTLGMWTMLENKVYISVPLYRRHTPYVCQIIQNQTRSYVTRHHSAVLLTLPNNIFIFKLLFYKYTQTSTKKRVTQHP